MVVKQITAKSGDESGQSLVEFLLMLPMMVGLVVILVRVNTVIQFSIVNQQYARAQTMWLTFNSAVYPALPTRQINLVAKNYNQMVLGVSENHAKAIGEYSPAAATYYIARRKGQPGGDDKAEPDTRALVRVRNTVTLCTQPNVIKGKAGYQAIFTLKGPGPFVADQASVLGESGISGEDYCYSPMQYNNSADGDG